MSDTQPKKGSTSSGGPLVCPCSYSTNHNTNMSRHQMICKIAADVKQRRIARSQLIPRRTLREQLIAKDRQLAAKDLQLAAKDRQIEQLIKRPRTVNNHNRFIVNNNVNVRRNSESYSRCKISKLLRDPETSVAKVVALQRAIPENENVTVPNVRERRWLVVEEECGEKQWKSKIRAGTGATVGV